VSLWQLGFAARVDYSGYGDLIFPLSLSSDINSRVIVRAKLDTGSTFCVFQRRYAELLGLDVESGTAQRIRTVTGSFTAYGHEITLTVGELEWQAVVYFAADENFPVNVVGRVGFLDRLRVGVVDYEQLLYLAAYDEA
jgi:predicted aspartyl protease